VRAVSIGEHIGREAPNRPRVRDHRERLPREARRAQLLSHALETFVDEGYHCAGMDEIAERAGVTKPVLYQHFPSKLDLYLALLDASCERLIEDCRCALASTEDNGQRVDATVRAFYAYVADESGAFRLVFESDLTSAPAVRERVDRVTHEIADMIARVIHDDTGLPDTACRLLAVSLVGMAQVSARFWLTDAGGITQADATALVSGLAWRGVRGYPKSEPAQ
jgi:AcrR family transcriptional regulator